MASTNLPLPFEGETKIDKFQSAEIRKVHHDGEWWFSVKDVLEALVETSDGTRYVSDLRKRDPSLDKVYSDITTTLVFESAAGPRPTTFINVEGIFRMLQSVPSERAEPFKRWLARVGYERLEEIENPELAVKRAIGYYRAKGYDDRWIEARIQGKVAREALTNEWQARGIEGNGYAILTDAIAVETFGVPTRTHREIKGLAKSNNLRDSMTPMELTLTTLGEQAALEITQSRDAQGLPENRQAAVRGGAIAGAARIQIEEATGQSVVSPKNYLSERQRMVNEQQAKEFGEMVSKMLSSSSES